jgi:hypothetical protein
LFFLVFCLPPAGQSGNIEHVFFSLADADCVVAEQGGGVASALLAQVSAMGDDELTVRARELAGEISAGEANLAVVLAEVERREVHSQWECRTIERLAGWWASPRRADGGYDAFG